MIFCKSGKQRDEYRTREEPLHRAATVRRPTSEIFDAQLRMKGGPKHEQHTSRALNMSKLINILVDQIESKKRLPCLDDIPDTNRGGPAIIGKLHL